MHEDESLWLKQSQQGNAHAFTRIVEKYEKPVFSLCYRMLGNSEDAEDAAQETFLRAFKNINRFDERRSFSTWLLSIAAHYCIDQHRRQRYRIVSIEDLPMPDLPDNSPGLELRISNTQDRERVQNLLKILNAVDKAIVILYYWNEFSYQEICQSLSLSESAVKSRLHRAKRAMARRWQELYAEGGIAERMVA